MFRILFLLILAFVTRGPVGAQKRFTEHVQRYALGQGIVVLHQSDAISDLVDGVAPVATSSGSQKTSASTSSSSSKKTTATEDKSTTLHQDEDTLQIEDIMVAQPTHRVRVNGFRIQVYAGGNSREAKYRAQQMENRMKMYYPELSTYTRFISPRWICHLGDFVNREDARKVLSELRSRGGFNDAIIVKCKVNTWVY